MTQYKGVVSLFETAPTATECSATATRGCGGPCIRRRSTSPVLSLQSLIFWKFSTMAFRDQTCLLGTCLLK